MNCYDANMMRNPVAPIRMLVWARAFAGMVVLALVILLTAGPDLVAQEESGWIRPGSVQTPPADQRRAPSRARVRAPAPAAAPEPAPEVEIVARVLVLGDSLAANLGQGLESIAAEAGDIAVSTEAHGSSGLVRDDFFNWPERIRVILTSDREIDIAVMVVGLNDRQALRLDGEALAPLSDPWREAYEARVDAIIEAFQTARIPLIWVGLPPMENAGLSADMGRLNDLIEERTRRKGAIHVDLWKGFVDDADRYTATGPDLSGQTARLRASDGIHFTRAGARKAAHFVDIELRRLVERPRDRVAMARAAIEAAEDARVRDAAIDTLIRRSLGTFPLAPGLDYVMRRDPLGPVLPLTRLDVSERGVLMSGRPPLDAGSRIMVDRALREGVAPPPLAGRADDFHWPRSP
ncbi:MAG: DUF459 domain-containing protein [Nocardiopsis sp. BM-2018]|nr:MAG: DUF459 domain-containing protein [Nocardiopsis sp. BM-2018]